MKTDIVVTLSRLRKRLQSNGQPPSKRVFVGFDGFVDTIMKAVKQRRHYSSIYFDTIGAFASRVNASAGKSGQIELVTERTKLGGNAPILANTLGNLGIQSYCAGSLGYPEVHPVFTGISDKCQVISLCNPGDSRAVEFGDGKIIFSELSSFSGYDWRAIKNTDGMKRIQDAICDSAIVAFVDWANLPFASEIWEGVFEDIIKPSHRRDFEFFFDLCDPSKKTTEQIDEILDLMSCFSAYGRVTLGLNENEVIKIWCAINGVDPDTVATTHKDLTATKAGSALFKSMNIHCLLVHPTDRIIVFQKNETIELKGRLVTDPKILTGGGDNLNAGYFLGLLHGYTLPECMLLAMATSGAYIQNGSSPDLDGIIKYIDTWLGDLTKVESPTRLHTHSQE